MPVYTYRREDGTTFDIRQSFADNALTVDPATGQRVVRVVQPAGIIFKGSGFYVTDSKSNNPAKPGATKRSDDGESSTSAKNGDGKEAKSESPAASTTSSTNGKAEPAAATSTTSTKSSAAAD
jgi:predicted nucleic acid-binding Zn ribbon protein